MDTDTEFTAASFECPGKHTLIIGALYRPPNGEAQQEYAEEICSNIRSLYQSHPRSTIWIAGDANLPDIDWEKNTVNGHSNPSSLNQLFLDTVYDNGSEQMVKFPTRERNTLDVFITNRPSLIQKCKPVPGVSDHDIVFVESNISATRSKPPQRKIFLWKGAYYVGMKESVNLASASFVAKNKTSTDINQLWGDFKDMCHQAITDNVPTKMTSTRFSQPWINRNAKRLSRRKKKAYPRAQQTNSHEDIEKYKNLQKETQFYCRKAYNNYVEDLVSGDDSNPKKLWSFIKAKKCDSSGISPLRRDGVAHSDPQVKANILNDQFAGAFTEEDTSSLPSLGPSPFPDVPAFKIGTAGVKKLLRGLKPHKASGPDNIPTRFLKEAANELAPALCLILTASLNQGYVPDDWKTADVTPIFKKGDRSTPANYRPISLTAACCKVMEHILHSQVMKHLDHHNILSDNQHGFRKKRSCESQLILTIQDLASGLEDGEQIDAILLDFSKAFDRVPHQRLLLKLQHYGIRGQLLSWIESFLTGRSQKVLVEGKTSSYVPVVSGVPQGTVLGSMLFLIYINDLPKNVTSTTRLFADDSLLYRRIRTTEDHRILQEDFNCLETWERDWQMSFNPLKCAVIRISKKRTQITGSYTIHGHQLATVKSGKYLGVTLTDNLSWNAHVDQVTKKANNSLAFLRRNLYNCPSHTKAQSYQTLVRPILEYASSAWDPYTQSSINKLEGVQRRAARFVTGDYRTTSSVLEMISNLGWETLQERRTEAKMVMMYRITYGLIDISATSLLLPATLSTRGNSMRYLQPFCRTDAYRCSFFPSGIRLWNQLPE